MNEATRAPVTTGTGSVREAVSGEARSLRDIAVAHAAAQGPAPFIIAPDHTQEPGRVLSYGGLLREARALAAELKARGLRAGDKVALLMPNGYQTASLFLGAMIGGFVVTPLNLRSSRAGLAYALDHCDCKILFASPAQSAQLAEALPLMSRKIANAAGTSPHGGVLVLAGDDHAAKSSTLPHQSEHIFKACLIPHLNPANVQDYLDLGLHGYAMSRF